MRVANGFLEDFQGHSLRLAEQCRLLNILWTPPPESSICLLLADCGAQLGSWRLKLAMTSGSSPALQLPRREGQLWLLLSPLSKAPSSSSPLRLSWLHSPLSAWSSRLKSLAYLERLYLRQQAIDQGYDEVLLVEPKSEALLETNCHGLFWIEGNSLFYPDEQLPLLASSSLRRLRDYLLADSTSLFIPQAVSCPLKEVKGPLFAINALRGILPVIEVAGRGFLRDSCLEGALQIAWERATAAVSTPISGTYP